MKSSWLYAKPQRQADVLFEDCAFLIPVEVGERPSHTSHTLQTTSAEPTVVQHVDQQPTGVVIEGCELVKPIRRDLTVDGDTAIGRKTSNASNTGKDIRRALTRLRAHELIDRRGRHLDPQIEAVE